MLDTFTFSSFRNPGQFDSSNCQFFSPDLATGPNVFTPGFTPSLACPVPADGVPGTPVHSSSSGPDISQAISGLLLKQDEKTNLFQLEYDFTRKFGARLGYRFRHRAIADADFEQVNEIFYPSNANRGDCALVAGAAAGRMHRQWRRLIYLPDAHSDRDRYRRSSDQRAFRPVRASGRGRWTPGESTSIWNWPARTIPSPASARGNGRNIACAPPTGWPVG